MKTVLTYILPVVIISVCFRVFDLTYAEEKGIYGVVQKTELKSGDPTNSPANIYEVKISVNVPVVKKLFFEVLNKPYSVLTSYSSSSVRFTARLTIFQSLYLSHHLLLV